MADYRALHSGRFRRGDPQPFSSLRLTLLPEIQLWDRSVQRLSVGTVRAIIGFRSAGFMAVNLSFSLTILGPIGIVGNIVGADDPFEFVRGDHCGCFCSGDSTLRRVEVLAGIW